ncbi:MAG: hypothetical protein U1F51_18380 [Burkholderiales bacterium]
MTRIQIRNLVSFIGALALAFAFAAGARAQPAGQPGVTYAPGAPAEVDKDGAAKTNVTNDFTDIWWPDAEPGWGIQLIQNVGTIFATMFVYGDTGAPRFYVASLINTGGVTFTGTLYSTTGPSFSAPWNPAAVTETAVGSMTFTGTGVATGNLTYNVGAVNVAKSLNRQPLALENNAGTYFLTDTYSCSGGACSPSSSGDESGTLTIAQTGTSSTFTIDWGFTVCTFPLTYSQAGRIGQYAGTMSCTSGVTGTANFFDVHNRVKMVTGRYTISNSIGCSCPGRFAAISTTP